MALATCPACNHAVSPTATTCPHCGHPFTPATTQLASGFLGQRGSCFGAMNVGCAAALIGVVVLIFLLNL